MSPQQIQTYAPLIAIAIVAPLILLRNRKPRKLNVNLLWVAPAIIVPMIGLGLYFGRPPHAQFNLLEGVFCVAGVALGAVAGWWRGKMTRINVDASDHTVTMQMSPAGLIFIFALIAVRRILGMEAEAGVVQLGFNPAVIAEILMVFAVGTIVAQRVELWIRANRMLAQVRGGVPA